MKYSSFSILSLVAVMIFSFSLTSCDKEDTTPTEDLTVTDEEIVELISGSLAYSSDGMTADAKDAADLANEVETKGFNTIECGDIGDSTFVRTYSDVRLTADYTGSMNWELNCSAIGIPTTLSFDRATAGTYESVKMSSADNAQGDWVLSDIIAGPNYVINGIYHRTGQQNSLIRDERSFTSTIDLEIDNLNMDKGERRIISGIASFTITGTTGTGETYAVDGDIVFLGGGAANILINGNAYSIDLF